MPLNFHEICRLCLSEKGTMIPIFDDRSRRNAGLIPLPARIMGCASVKLFAGDGLPALICQHCLQQVNTSYDFKLRCESSDATLHHYVGNICSPAHPLIDSQMEIELEPVMYEDLEADGSFNTKSNIGIKEEDNSSLSTSDNVRVSSASSSPCTNTREITCNEDVAGIAEDSSSCRSIQEKDDKRFRPVVNHSTQRLQGRTIRNRKVKGGRQRKMKSSLPSSNIVPLWKSDLRNEHADGGASESDDSNEKDSMDNPGTIFSDEHRTAMQHILNQKPFQCTICKKAFGVKSSLMHHLKFHTGEKPFACPVCKKSFITKDHLARHIRVHTGERPYKCSVCTKSFSMKHHLTAHLRLHTGEKPFQCVACKRSFTQRAHLTDHLRFHSGEKPYQCSFCGKTFTLRSSLTHHLRVHSSEKPFECSVCSKLFTNKGDLTCHHRVHTGEKPYECTVCRKTFTKRSNLTRHNKTHVEHLQDLV